jgi:hypothetical protein
MWMMIFLNCTSPPKKPTCGFANVVNLVLAFPFPLWFNMHKFERRPRKGKSPYEIAGIKLNTDDWLTLLGYPKEPD